MKSKDVIRKLVREAFLSEGMFSNFAQFTDPLIAKINNSKLAKGSSVESVENNSWNNHDIFVHSMSRESVAEMFNKFKKLISSNINDLTSVKNLENIFKEFKEVVYESMSVYKMRNELDDDLIGKLNKCSKKISNFLHKNSINVEDSKFKNFLGIGK